MLFDNISLETVDVYGRNKNEYLRNKTSYNNLGTYSRGGSLNQALSIDTNTGVARNENIRRLCRRDISFI